ncbi:MAG: hypothetical protein K2K48_02980 [Anaeroplasmataceae bacterium]|nr:hypothetical protein [Anaeroplasmataceae bacterium]MDE6414354.1 hypothetical protein [Anaeroplasmataceae bacterium]
MQYQVDDFKVLASNQEPLEKLIQKKFHLKNFKLSILSKSIDARKKSEVYLVYRLLITTDEVVKGKTISLYQKRDIQPIYPSWKEAYSPVVVGFGPAGIFASLYLARCGAKPVIIERGGAIEERIASVQSFLENKTLNPNSNVQFGEGGAGAFSDGKLTCNRKHPLIGFIFRELVAHGAHEDILYDSMPHVGTDVLREVVKNIRLEIERLGGCFYFNTTFLDWKNKEDSIEILTTGPSFQTKHLLLGIGHSARDTIRHLYKKIPMEAKAFSMGVRVEHLAEKIDKAQYGEFFKFLPKAYYKLATHKDGRGIYTFCMCPGGYVLASASEANTIVTNGMSNYAREGINSNSAILVDVRPEDYGATPLDGIAYQEKYEHLAFDIAKSFSAPANLMKEFMEDRVACTYRSIIPTYPHGLIFTDLRKCLPDYVVEGIKSGILEFNQRLKGFYDEDAILIGIESRSSSPVRILRDKITKAAQEYIYPIGEGAGYAGGIISASLDGLLTAMKIGGEEYEC